MLKSRLWMPILAGLALFAVNCVPKPTAKEMDGKVRGKASLQLADGSTISQDGSDEYNPYLLKLDDGYLVLVFGSNRNGLHNIYMTKSLEPYNGFEIPFFNPPALVTISSSPIDDPSPISFAAYSNGANVFVAFNYYSVGQIRIGSTSNFAAPDITSLTTPDNTNHYTDTIVGVSADGNRLLSTDAGGIAYSFDPNNGTDMGTGLGGFFDYSESITQVRQQNTGFDDSYMAVYYGGTFAGTKDMPFGSIFDFDISLLESGLFISHMTTFYGNDASEDLVLFSAFDGISDDIYVVTSHTSGMLWSLVAFMGSDTFSVNAPYPEHYFDFETATCGQDFGWVAGWAGSCGFTPTSPSYNFTDYAPFTSAENMSLSNVQFDPLGEGFTIAAWILVDTSCDATNCTIIANADGSADGFRFYYDGTSNSLKFWSTSSSVSATAEAMAGIIPEDGLTWVHVAVVADSVNGTAKLYIYGTDFSILTSAEAGFATGPANARVGQFADGTYGFRGGIDNLLVYEYQLTDAEVSSLLAMP
ncbi:MAG: LamG domain-containing protein [Turneriella sp.]